MCKPFLKSNRQNRSVHQCKIKYACIQTSNTFGAFVLSILLVLKKKKKKKVDGDVDCFYIVLFSALEHTHCALKYIRLEQAGVVDHSA